MIYAGTNQQIVSRAVAVAVMAFGIAGCSASPSSNNPPTVMTPALIKQLQQEGATPDSVSPDMLTPDGTLKNGLLPEQWGDTS